MMYDLSTAADDEGYQFRSRILASPTQGQKVDEVSVVLRGEDGWHTVSLTGRPVFPNLGTLEDQEKFEDRLLELRVLQVKSDILKKNSESLKNRFFKDKSKVVTANSHRFFWSPAGSSNVNAIVDDKGERVSRVPIVFDNGARLICPDIDREKIRKAVKTYTKPEQIVELELARKELRRDIEELSREVRPYELGLIERNELSDTVTVNATSLTIERFSDKDYDLPQEAIDKLETGEFKITSVPTVRGRWLMEPIAVEEVAHVEQPTAPE